MNMDHTFAAAVVSRPQPLDGQDHRSSHNFYILGGEYEYRVVAPEGMKFDIKHDETGTDATMVKGVENGSTIAKGTLKQGDAYYIANPKGSSKDGKSTFPVLLARMY